MNNIQCIIIDDESIAVRILERHLSFFPEINILATFHLPDEALSFLSENPVDLLFLDIKMPQMTGIELLKSCSVQPAVIFTTAFRNYAVEAYDLDVIDYLVKPIPINRLRRAISRLHERLNSQLHSPEAIVQNAYINIKSNKEVIRLNVNSIQYVESLGDYIIIYHDAGKLISRNRISHMEEELEDILLRIHRRYLVSPKRIESVLGNIVKLNNKQIPVGRTYRQNLHRIINQ